MKFYHFTRKDALESILEKGIFTGIAPLGLSNVFVSLTSLLEPSDNGLITGQNLIENVSSQFEFMAGHYPKLVTGVAPKRELQLFDQTEIVLEINIEEDDHKLSNYDSYIDLVLKQNQVAPSQKELYKAAGLASARFPVGGANEAQDLETIKILESKKPIAPNWYFYKGVIPPSMITVKYRNSSGGYS